MVELGGFVKTCNGKLVHIEKSTGFTSPHLGIDEKKKTGQPNGPLPGPKTTRDTEGESHFAFDTVFAFIAAFADRTLVLLRGAA